uniref:F-box and leucine rich repeat protein 13 n=1 Tax=Athene cunicularia TaxID=194338 RepID=A0A663LS53_ATHCN
MAKFRHVPSICTMECDGSENFFLQVLLCGVIVMRPEDPLTFLEEKLRGIMEKGLDAVLWYILNDFVCAMWFIILNLIFRYVNLVDLARCAQVSQTWMLLTQNSSLWSDINFSSVKHKVQDQIVVNILQKWRPYVLHLNFRGCYSLHWPTFKSISECKNLQDLNLSECQGLNDESMRLVSEGCRALLYLNLLYTDITDGTLRLLSSSFPNLQYLSLAHCRKFTDKGLLYLGTGKGCHKLIYLDLSGCIQISVDGFRNIARGCSGIQDLLINKMPTLTDRCIQALVEKCQQIVSVVFLDSPHLSDTTFKALAECKLVKVSIEGNSQITDLSFKLMSKFCPYIRHIHVADCQKITDAGLEMISPLKHILVLNIADCIRISDGGIRSFVQGSSGTKLRELNLTNCIRVTDLSVTEIAQRCHELTYLNLRYCENVTDAGIEALGNMSSLISIDLSGTSISDMVDSRVMKLQKGDASICVSLIWTACCLKVHVVS